MDEQNKPVKVDKLISDSREIPRDTRKASLDVYDLCIAAADRLANDKSHILALQKEIEKLRNARRWIPAAERLPEDDERVLAYCKDHMIHDMKWSWVLNEWFDKISGGRYFEEFVTHWMPLPEPPGAPEASEMVFTNADRVRKMSNEDLAKFIMSRGGTA